MEPFEIKQDNDDTTVYVVHTETGRTVKFTPSEIIPDAVQQTPEAVVYDDLGGIYLAEMADGTALDAELVDFAWAFYNRDASNNARKSDE